MQANRFVKFSGFAENNVNQATIIEVESSHPKSDIAKPDLTGVYDVIVFMMPIGFIAFWGMFILISTDMWAFARHGLQTMKHGHRVPCKDCRFYANNPYLRCALHPDSALTNEAINCPDYSPQEDPTVDRGDAGLCSRKKDEL